MMWPIKGFFPNSHNRNKHPFEANRECQIGFCWLWEQQQPLSEKISFNLQGSEFSFFVFVTIRKIVANC